MRQFEINIPEGCIPSFIGFATNVLEKTHEFTSEDIQIKVGDGPFLDAKSILGLRTVNFNEAKTLSMTVIGECEDYAAPKLERFMTKLLNLYVND